jgi:hypothetical protein
MGHSQDPHKAAPAVTERRSPNLPPPGKGSLPCTVHTHHCCARRGVRTVARQWAVGCRCTETQCLNQSVDKILHVRGWKLVTRVNTKVAAHRLQKVPFVAREEVGACPKVTIEHDVCVRALRAVAGSERSVHVPKDLAKAIKVKLTIDLLPRPEVHASEDVRHRKVPGILERKAMAQPIAPHVDAQRVCHIGKLTQRFGVEGQVMDGRRTDKLVWLDAVDDLFLSTILRIVRHPDSLLVPASQSPVLIPVWQSLASNGEAHLLLKGDHLQDKSHASPIAYLNKQQSSQNAAKYAIKAASQWEHTS